VLQRVRRIVHQPSDLVLALRIGYFLLTTPGALGRTTLPILLDRLRSASRPRARDVRAGVERIMRLRQAWMRLPIFRARDTCYLRALSLYRFLDAGDNEVRIHFGIEPGTDPTDRLRGHAWVVVNQEMFEVPDPVQEGRVREIYRHPPGG
jgi:hypothetical protein